MLPLAKFSGEDSVELHACEKGQGDSDVGTSIKWRHVHLHVQEFREPR